MKNKLILPIPDDQFIRGDVPMTKEEIRTLTLSKLMINSSSNVIDIGAGTGSISIECALIADRGKVIAIEKNRAAVDLIKKNISKFDINNITVIKGEARDELNQIDSFDRIFIGGSGGSIKEILSLIDKRIINTGRIVINSITLDTLTKTAEFFKGKNYNTEIIQVSISRCIDLKGAGMFKALNPIFITTAVKE